MRSTAPFNSNNPSCAFTPCPSGLTLDTGLLNSTVLAPALSNCLVDGLSATFFNSLARSPRTPLESNGEPFMIGVAEKLLPLGVTCCELGETVRWDSETSLRSSSVGATILGLIAGFRVVGPKGGVGSGLSRTESGRECDLRGPRMVTLFVKSITSSSFPPASSPISLTFTTCDSPSSLTRSLLA